MQGILLYTFYVLCVVVELKDKIATKLYIQFLAYVSAFGLLLCLAMPDGDPFRLVFAIVIAVLNIGHLVVDHFDKSYEPVSKPPKRCQGFPESLDKVVVSDKDSVLEYQFH